MDAVELKDRTIDAVLFSVPGRYDLNDSRGMVRVLAGDALVGFVLPAKMRAEVLDSHDELVEALERLDYEVGTCTPTDR